MTVSREFSEKFSKENPPAPGPRDDSVIDNYHGYEVTDPYRPLEDLQAKHTTEWTGKQHERFASFIETVEGQDEMAAKLDAMMDYGRESTPSRYGDKWFSSYNDGKSPHSVYYVRDSLEGEPRIFLDPNEMDKDGRISISTTSISPDGKRVAYLTSLDGSDEKTLHIRDVETGKDLPDVIEGCRFSGVAWDRDSSEGFQYTYPATDNLKRFALKHHAIGQNPKTDPVIFEREGLAESMVWGVKLRDQDGKWGAYDLMTSDVGTDPATAVFFRDRNSKGPFKPLFDDGKSTFSPQAEVNGKIYAVTNHDAPRGRLVAVDPAKPEPEHWETIIAQPEKDVLEWVHIQKGKMLVSYSHDTASKIDIHELDGTYKDTMPLPTQSVVGFSRINPEDTSALINISGFQSAGSKYRYDFEKNSLDLWKESDCPVNLKDAVVERIYATSKDGTQVPMTVIRRKDVEMDGSAAVKLYGYGGFNVPLDPGFGFGLHNWVSQGGIYVQANLRGGGEFGKEWYDEGRLHNKQNVFDDFAACAEHLIENKYTSPERLAIQGGSNGGLLTLATVLQRPELFGAVVSDVPVTDMYRFAEHTYGAFWKSDYGDPKNSKEDFETASKYSPLHNVKKGGKYPPILVATADTDDRVVPSHAFKFVAEFQEKADPQSLCVMRLEENAGHGAGKPKAKTIREMVEVNAFVEQAIGPIDQKKFKAQQAEAGKDKIKPDGWAAYVSNQTEERGQGASL